MQQAFCLFENVYGYNSYGSVPFLEPDIHGFRIPVHIF